MSASDSTGRRAHNFQDLTGRRFGRLTVAGFLGRGGTDKNAPTLWACRCDCGADCRVRAGDIKSGNTTSCGCAKPGPKACESPGCDRTARARGVCLKHYYAAKRGGLLPGASCLIGGCDRPSFVHGWCNMHYRRWANHGDPLVGPAVPRGAAKQNPCAVPGCRERARGSASGVTYCRTHLPRVKKHGDPHTRLRVGNGEATPEQKKAQAAERQRRYLATPHGKLRAAFNRAKQRALKYGSDWETGLTKDVLLRLYAQAECAVCGLPMTDGDKTLDHIIPLSKGGSNTAANLQLAHGACNTRKGNRLPAGSLF